MLTIRNWPPDERPREKLIAKGAAHLSVAELLAIFLRTGTKGKTALDVAKGLLQHFGSLKQLLTANLQEFCQVPGLGAAKYAQLQAVLELNRRYLYEALQTSDVLQNPKQTREYLLSRLSPYKREVFACLFLTNQHQVINFTELFYGNDHQADIYLGEIVKAALLHHASAVIIAHNHPSGDPEPSLADNELTCELQKALALVDIRLLDHIIITANQAISLAEKGILLPLSS